MYLRIMFYAIRANSFSSIFLGFLACGDKTGVDTDFHLSDLKAGGGAVFALVELARSRIFMLLFSPLLDSLNYPPSCPRPQFDNQ